MNTQLHLCEGNKLLLSGRLLWEYLLLIYLYTCRQKVPGSRDARVRVAERTENFPREARRDSFKAFTATPLNNGLFFL